MGQRVLVTGAGGFIGSHLVELLVREGHEVRAFLRYNGRDDRGPSTARRMERYHKEALPLAAEACRKALADAGLAPSEITHLPGRTPRPSSGPARPRP